MRLVPFHWQQRNNKDLAFSIEKPALERLLEVRDLATEDVENFFNPKLSNLKDPNLIPGNQDAVKRILKAIDTGESVAIFGDYDVDGISSITLMATVLEAYGITPRTFIPKRSHEGYGLSQMAIQRFLAEGEKPSLLICVDCGTVSTTEIAHLKKQGIETIVIDHHEPNTSSLPECAALVNPKLGSNFEYLCAAGVVFKVAHALAKARPTSLDLKQLLPIVAIATVADIVPLVDENRILVRHGLRLFSKIENQGLNSLIEKAGIRRQPESLDISFKIAPRINAAGRMDMPEVALRLFQSKEKETAASLADQLDGYNRERQAVQAKIKSEAVSLLSETFDERRNAVIVIGSRDWHPGVVGIVASGLMRKYHKPTFVIAFDEDGIGKGSGRSIPDVSLVDAIRSNHQYLLSGGGHDMAAGLSIHEDQLEIFRRKFDQYVIKTTTTEQRLPKLIYDIEVRLEELTLEFLSSYSQLQPFGNQNPQPVFISKNVHLTQSPYHMKNNHLRLNLFQDGFERDAVFFGGGEFELPPTPWDIAFKVDRNEFRGNVSVQILIEDIRETEGD